MDSIFCEFGATNVGPKEASKVNSELEKSQTKISALAKLKKILSSQDEATLSGNIINWLKKLSQIISQGRHPAAAENFCTILTQACQVSSISRDIATNLIPTLLTTFLQVEEKDSNILLSIEAILTTYPTSCGSARSQIVKAMLPLMMSTYDERVREIALRCWVSVPFLGGGGPQKSLYSQQWQEQLKVTLKTLTSMFNLYCGQDRKESKDLVVGNLSLPFTNIPKEEPDRSNILTKRVCILCKCLHGLLDIDFPHSLPIPLDSLIKVILHILDVTPQMGNTTEMKLRALYLPQIHMNALALFVKLTKICRRNMCRYSSAINSSFSALLDLWKDKTPVPGRDRKYHIIRENVYKALLEWVQNCGATTRFMCGQSTLNQSFLMHLIDDIEPIRGNLMPVSKVNTGGRGPKAKKRRFAEATNDMVNGNSIDRIQDPQANQFLTSAALSVVAATVNTMGHRLSASLHKIFQETIIKLVLDVQQSNEISPYSRCPLPRLHLYKVLSALLLSPSTSVAPPTALSTRIFVHAASKETNAEIRGFCINIISSLNSIVHPWRNTWQIYGVEKLDDERNENSIKQIIPVMEPMNVDEDENDGADSEKSSVGAQEDVPIADAVSCLENGESEVAEQEDNLTANEPLLFTSDTVTVAQNGDEIHSPTTEVTTNMDDAPSSAAQSEDGDETKIEEVGPENNIMTVTTNGLQENSSNVNTPSGELDLNDVSNPKAKDVMVQPEAQSQQLAAPNEDEVAASLSCVKDEDNSEELDRMIMDFVDAAPEEEES